MSTRHLNPAATDAPAFDAGLRDYMTTVYRYLTMGLGISAVSAYAIHGIATTDVHVEGASRVARGLWLTPVGETLLGWKVLLLTLVASIGIIFAMSRSVGKASYLTSVALYSAFTAIFGLVLFAGTVRYSAASVVQVLAITTTVFGAMSIYGYTTKRDLTGFGAFLFMGLVGLIGVGLVNAVFLHSTGLQTLMSAVGVLVFVGFTAYDTQKIKESYSSRMGTDGLGALAVWGAMDLYLDFVNLFLDLLRLLGDAGGSVAGSIGESLGD